MTSNYRKPDLNAPRFREKVFDIIAYPENATLSFFSRMKEKHPYLAKYSNTEIAKYIKAFNETIANAVHTNRNGIALPENLGILMVTTCKVPPGTARNNIDFGASNRLGVAVPHMNMHSEGNVAKINYTTATIRKPFTNQPLWVFKPCRNFQRAVSQAFKNGDQNRYKMTSKQTTVAKLLRKPRIQKAKSNNALAYAALLAKHDEFAID